MSKISPAGWIAILVFVATVVGCVAMIYIAQSNQWSPMPNGATASSAAAETHESGLSE